MLGMGPTELIVIIILALVIFGPKRLPEIVQYVGKAINQIKELTNGVQEAVTKDIVNPINEELIKPITNIKDSVLNDPVKVSADGAVCNKNSGNNAEEPHSPDSQKNQAVNESEGASV
ncbi:MAG: twin-arginine translocase TatA/TatE family subunit [Rubrobacteridae bacterium]|nr:twin-arginine translocase TatA/TatE family subunit [Rubrobacteridae bacterium]